MAGVPSGLVTSGGRFRWQGAAFVGRASAPYRRAAYSGLRNGHESTSQAETSRHTTSSISALVATTQDLTRASVPSASDG